MIGFVRWEHVISGGESTIQYSCGRCNHAWDVADDQSRYRARKSRARSDKPEPPLKPEP